LHLNKTIAAKHEANTQDFEYEETQ
jgi:hypothetical protein